MAITASLCDSRSCNQTGGGEHLKSDIEDLLTLLPPPAADAVSANADGGGGKRGGKQHRATLTTCFGMCNHSPNIQLKSAGGHPSLIRRRGKLVNDGGLRMRVEEEVEDSHKVRRITDGSVDDIGEQRSNEQQSEKEEDFLMEATDNVMVSNATISKVARVIGLKRPLAIRALESNSQGNKFLRSGRYDDALECYTEGRALLLQIVRGDHCEAGADNNIEGGDGDDNQRHYLRSSANKLLSKMTLSCAQTRVQWASELDDGEKVESTEMLRLAAGDAFSVLLKSLKNYDTNGTAINSSGESNDADVRCIVAKLVHCSAGLQTQMFISNDESQAIQGSSDTCRGGQEEGVSVPSLFCDVTLVVQFCIMLTDAWRGLAHSTFTDGALIAYRGALAIAFVSKARVLRAKERRRIEKAIAALE